MAEKTTAVPSAALAAKSAKRETGNKSMYGDKITAAFQPKGKIKQNTAMILGIVAFLLILILWSGLSYGKMVDPLFLPTPTATLQASLQLFSSGFWTDIGMTVFRVMTGFIIAAVVAIPLGVLIGTYAPISAFFEPVFSFVRYMPASAFIPLFIFWIGIGESEKVAIIILGSLPQLVLMTATNIRNVHSSLIEVSYTLGTNRKNVLWKVILPKAMPDITDTLRIVLGWAWTYVIVAEMVGASSGIGFKILQAQRTVDVGKIFVGILILGLIGLIIDNLLLFLNKKLYPWNE